MIADLYERKRSLNRAIDVKQRALAAVQQSTAEEVNDLLDELRSVNAQLRRLTPWTLPASVCSTN